MSSWRTKSKRGVGRALRPLLRMRAPCMRWVLTLHEVGDHPWAARPTALADILDSVCATATVLSLSDLIGADEAGALRVSLTFDDGYAGVAKEAASILERFQVPATVFLPTDLLAQDDAVPLQDRGLYGGIPLMGWRTVRRLADSGRFRFESHGSAHRPLPRLSPDARRDDLRRSRDAILSATGRPSRILAYPFGAVDQETAAMAHEVGFDSAFTTRHGGLRRGADPLVLPRVDVRADYSARDILAILRGDWDYLSWVQGMRGNRA